MPADSGALCIHPVRHGRVVPRVPSDAPHLERAWDNFQRLLPPWLRQMAGLEPVPWSSALEVVCTRLATRSVDWWLTGSAALAVRGVAVRPRDLDLVVAGEHARLVGDLLLDGLVEPVSPAEWFCTWWGRAVCGARVEWVGGVGPRADDPLPTDFGLAAQARLETVHWRGHVLRVPPIGLQREVCVRRGLSDRVKAIDSFGGARGLS